MPAPQASAPVPADRIDFINKDDTWGILFALNKKIPDPRCTHTDKHFHKIRTADMEKRDHRLTGNRPGQKRFAGAGRTQQQHPFGDSASKAGILCWVL